MSNQDELKLIGVMQKGYGIIPKLVMKDKELSIEAKAIYAYFCSYAGAGNTAFPSVELICYDLNISDNRYRKHRQALINKGYLEVSRYRTENGFSKNVYTLPSEVLFVSLQNVGIRNVGIQSVGIQNVGIQNVGTNNNKLNNNSINNNSTYKDVALQDISLHKKIIDYLNYKTKKRYKHDSKSNQKYINGRISEGYDFDDFKQVIDIKVEEWIGTKMEQYLRPSTLFNSEKFEAYLNQGTKIKKEKDSLVKYDYGF